MNKQLALQRTRMYAALRESHPLYFGDPLEFHRAQLSGFSGPAYEQRNGGGAGLIGAVLAVATGGMSLGFTTLASTLSTISLVGSVVGAVTGNKAFSTIGAIAGLGGAFMNLSSAGEFGKGMQSWASDTNASIMGTTSQSAAPVSDAIVRNVSEAGTVGADTVTQTMNAGTGIDSLGQTNLANTSGPAVNADTASTYDALKADSGLISTPQPSIDPLTTGPQANGTVSGLDANGNAMAPASNSSIDIAKMGEPVNAMAAKAAQGGNLAQTKAASGGIDTGTSLFDRISEFANKNKALTEMALKGVQGMYQSPQDKALKDSQIDVNNSMVDFRNAQIAEAQRQAANGNAVPNVGGMSVNRNAQVFNQRSPAVAGVRPAGLIQTRA